MFDPDTQGGNPLVDVFVHLREILPTWFLLWLYNRYLIQAKPLKPRILNETAAGGQGIVAFICQLFVMFFPGYRLGEEEDSA